MTRLPPQPRDHLDRVEASILEPEVPAGGSERLYRQFGSLSWGHSRGLTCELAVRTQP